MRSYPFVSRTGRRKTRPKVQLLLGADPISESDESLRRGFPFSPDLPVFQERRGSDARPKSQTLSARLVNPARFPSDRPTRVSPCLFEVAISFTVTVGDETIQSRQDLLELAGSRGLAASGGGTRFWKRLAYACRRRGKRVSEIETALLHLVGGLPLPYPCARAPGPRFGSPRRPDCPRFR